ELWAEFEARLDRIDVSPANPLRLAVRFAGDPASTHGETEDLVAAIAGLTYDAEFWVVMCLGTAAIQAERTHLFRGFAQHLFERASGDGALELAIVSSMVLCIDDFLRGNWSVAQDRVRRGLAHALSTGDRWMATAFQHCQALLAAVQGDDVTAQIASNEL